MLQTLADWHNVFLLTGSVVLVAVIFYGMFGSGKWFLNTFIATGIFLALDIIHNLKRGNGIYVNQTLQMSISFEFSHALNETNFVWFNIQHNNSNIFVYQPTVSK